MFLGCYYFSSRLSSSTTQSNILEVLIGEHFAFEIYLGTLGCQTLQKENLHLIETCFEINKKITIFDIISIEPFSFVDFVRLLHFLQVKRKSVFCLCLKFGIDSE